MKNKLKYIVIVLVFIPCLFIFSACSRAPYVVGIERSSSSTAMTDVYTITYSDGSTDSFSVTNGEDGKDLNIEDIYNVAKEKGYSGTFLEFLELYLDMDIPTDNSACINKSLMSVVSVYSEFNYESGNFLSTQKNSAVGYGSGVVYKLDKTAGDMYIITNYHVLYASVGSSCVFASDIKLSLYGNTLSFDWPTNKDGSHVLGANGYPLIEYDGDYLSCDYVGGSLLYDIAVLKVSNSSVVKNSGLIQARIGNSDDIIVGQEAIAIGNPQNLGIGATQGVVTVASEYAITTLANGQYAQSRVIRMDTAVNGGNSGGGLFNAKGELIGIVNSKLIDEKIENIGYAIPSNIATSVADNIIKNSGSQEKKAYKATMGITLDAQNARAAYDENTGRVILTEDVYIDSVVENSLAEQAGIKKGDKITAMTVKGQKYTITRLHHVVDLGWKLEAGDVVSFTIEGKADPINIIITADCFSYVD